MNMVTALNGGAALTAFVAAVFWFISACAKLPIFEDTYNGLVDNPQNILEAMKQSAKWNSCAATFAGVSALFMTVVTIVQILK